mgnify:CR=1 FL=1
MTDADEIQYEQTVRQWWTDPEWISLLDLLDEQRMEMILNGEEDGDTEN